EKVAQDGADIYFGELDVDRTTTESDDPDIPEE
ncbi:FeS assembly protein SufA, partial [Halobacteriales archaeon QH_1_68_42]